MERTVLLVAMLCASIWNLMAVEACYIDKACDTDRWTAKDNKIYRFAVPFAANVYKIQLKKETSKTHGTCQGNVTYGFYGSEMWLDGGCSGEFSVCYYKGLTQTVSCESKDYQRRTCTYTQIHECHLPTVSVMRADSKSPCVEGYSFEASESAITVSKGCRGTFRIGCHQC